ncbi:hypothetical protein Tco_1131743, partial [Tanacetum coccineum]
MTMLHSKEVKFEWAVTTGSSVPVIEGRSCVVHNLALPKGKRRFYRILPDASIKGLGDVLMQREK